MARSSSVEVIRNLEQCMGIDLIDYIDISNKITGLQFNMPFLYISIE
jgi:hypothetical protein